MLGLTNWNDLTCPPLRERLGPTDLATITKMWDGWSTTACSTALGELTFNTPTTSQTYWNTFVGIFLSGACSLVSLTGEKVIQLLFAPANCDYVAIAPPVLIRAIASFIEHWLDVGLDDFITTLNYTIDRNCPTLLPDQSGINAAYLGNQITFDTWQCWTRAVNDLDKPAFSAMYSGRNQPNVQQWISAWQRQLITENDLSGKLRGAGVLDKTEETIFKRLMEQLPGPGDLVRFMLRDVEDPNVVGRFNLDAEFNNKFQGLLANWATGQGISRDVMVRYWRAHWQWPSPSQLYDMLHQLRADSLDPNKQRLAINLNDVLEVLGINDVIPFWRERLAAVSYRLPRLTDAFAFYHNRIWGEPQLLDYYQSYGYPLAAAKDKVSLDKRKSIEKYESEFRLVTKSKVTTSFVNGVIGELEFDMGMKMAGLDDAQIVAALDQAVYLRAIKLREKLLKAIKCQFSTCGINATEAVASLIASGWQPADAQYEVTCWKQQCGVKPKQITASILCKWYGDGLISLADYRSRLAVLGYSRYDIDRIVAQCQIDLAQKAAKAAKGSKNGTTATVPATPA